MGNHGGKRIGAGRKTGTPNHSTSYAREVALEYSEGAFQTLGSIMKNEKAPAASRIAAAKELIERAYGKTASFVTVPAGLPDNASEAFSTISRLVSSGEISTEDADRLSSFVVSRMKAIEIAEIQARLEALEAN